MWGDQENKNLIKILRGGGVAVMPTDTLYGMVGSAQNVSVVNRIYALRKRNPKKPCIILIGDISELKNFSINISEKQKEKLKKYWSFSPTQDLRPISVVLDCPDESFSYLHRGTKTLAFRLPAIKELRDLLLETGPLIAPSANPEGLLPAKTIEEAKKYFNDSVDLYIDGGMLAGEASKVVRLHLDGSVSILR